MRDRPDQPAPHPAPRLNLLLSYAGWRDTPAVEQLARLLEPLGISSYTADTGEQAADVIRQLVIHIAVVDWTIPLCRSQQPGHPMQPSGGRILQLLRRLDAPPPTVIIRPPQAATRENVRGLTEALRQGAFAVVDRPLQLETMLEVMRRALIRHYAGIWPGEQKPPPRRGTQGGENSGPMCSTNN